MAGASWSVLFHALLVQLAANLARPAAAYHALELGTDPALLGLIAGSFSLLPLFVAVWAGRAIDAGHERPLLLAGAGLMVVAGVGLLFATPTPWALAGWNAVLGFGHLLSILGEQSRLARSGGAQMDRVFGVYTFAGTSGQALAPMILAVVGGGAAIPHTGVLFAAYLAAAVLLAASTVWVCASGPEPSPGTGGPPSRVRDALNLDPATRRSMVGAIGVSMAVLCAVDLIQVYLPALGVERGLPSAVVGGLLTLRALATMVSRLSLERLVRRWGRQRLVVWTTIASAVAVAALAVPWPGPPFVQAAVLAVLLIAAGYGLGVGQPLSMSLVSLAAAPGTQSTWLAIRLSGNRLAQTAIPPTLGLLAGGVGAGGVFLAMAALLGATGAWAGRR